MDTLSYKTISANKETARKEWVLVDASGFKLGRLASAIASLARGKHKTNFTPHADCGDYVVVVNADKIELSGGKWEQKEYQTYSGYQGGQRRFSAQQMHDKNPAKMIELAVRGMLPKNKLGRKILGNVYVYNNEEHLHEGQKPKKIDIKAYL